MEDTLSNEEHQPDRSSDVHCPRSVILDLGSYRRVRRVPLGRESFGSRSVHIGEWVRVAAAAVTPRAKIPGARAGRAVRVNLSGSVLAAMSTALTARAIEQIDETMQDSRWLICKLQPGLYQSSGLAALNVVLMSYVVQYVPCAPDERDFQAWVLRMAGKPQIEPHQPSTEIPPDQGGVLADKQRVKNAWSTTKLCYIYVEYCMTSVERRFAVQATPACVGTMLKRHI